MPEARNGEPDDKAAALSRWAIQNRTLVWRTGLLAVTLMAATGLRLAAGDALSGVPFLFYFPAVIVIAVLAGSAFGIASVAASAVLCWLLFLPPPAPTALTIASASSLLAFLVAGLFQVWVAHLLRQALRRAIHSEARAAELLDVSSDIVWIADGGGRALAPNRAWEAATGSVWPDYAGRAWLKSVHPDDIAVLQPLAGSRSHEADIRLHSAASGDWRWYHSRSVMIAQLWGGGSEWITALSDVHDEKLSHDRRDLVLGEMRHRMQNLVAVIEALARSSKSGDGVSVEDFLEKFLGRLHALGAAADLLLSDQRKRIECGALVRATLKPFSDGSSNRFAIAGPAVVLSEGTGGSLAMAIHELATNAVKYGALSSPHGNVSIAWSLSPPNGADQVFAFVWKESGGPRPSPPERRGFGSRVIGAAASRERQGNVEIDYEPDGLRCRISFVLGDSQTDSARSP